MVYPADVVLFEGILVFYSQEIRDMFHLRLFVDTDSDVRLSRRGKADAGLAAPGRPGPGSRGSEGPHPAPVATVLRDVHRGRDLEQILTQYTTFVKPAFEEFCLPVPPSACLGTSLSPFSEGPPVPHCVRAKPWRDVVCCINGELAPCTHVPEEPFSAVNVSSVLPVTPSPLPPPPRPPPPPGFTPGTATASLLACLSAFLQGAASSLTHTVHFLPPPWNGRLRRGRNFCLLAAKVVSGTQ